MNLVDSSGWLEYLADGPNADFFANSILATADLLVPTLSLYEVFKRVLQQRGEDDALQAVALMQQGMIVELSVSLALSARALVSTTKFRWPIVSCWRPHALTERLCGAKIRTSKISLA